MEGDIAIAGPRTTDALKKLENALARLEAAAVRNAKAAATTAAADDDRARLEADRAALASQLDEAETRAQRLRKATREVEGRLVSLMERVRRLDGGLGEP